MPFFKKRYRKKNRGFRSKRKFMKKKMYRKYKPTGLYRKKNFNRMLTKVSEKKHRSIAATNHNVRAVNDAASNPWTAMLSALVPTTGIDDDNRIGRKIHCLWIVIYMSFSVSSTQSGYNPIRALIVKAKERPSLFNTYFREPELGLYATTPASIGEPPIMRNVFIPTNLTDQELTQDTIKYNTKKIYIPIHKDLSFQANGETNIADIWLAFCAPGVTTTYFKVANPVVSVKAEIVYTDV